MTKSMSYCSLEEAWGDNYTIDENKNENNENNISYSGGDQYSDELIPQYIKDSTTIQQKNENQDFSFVNNNANNNILTNDMNIQNNPTKSLITLNDVNKDKLWEEFIKFLQTKNIQNVNQNNNINEEFSNIENFDLKQANNSYVDLIILILFGIIIIFIMDSFVRLGKNTRD